MSTPLDLLIAQMTEACVYRRAYFERVYRVRDDGRIVYDKVAYRPAATCYLARDEKTGEFAGFKQYTYIKGTWQYVIIGADRAFVHIHGANRDPMVGKSDLEVAFHLYDTKQKILYLMASFLENQSIPRARAKVHKPGAHTEAEAFAERAAGLKSGGVIAETEEEELIAFEASHGATSDFNAALSYLDSQMLDSVLAGFLNLTGAHSGRGSYALSRDQSQFYMQNRQGAAKELALTVTAGGAMATQAGLCSDLVRWNFGPQGKVPRLVFDSLTQTDTTDQLVAIFQTLASTPTPPLSRDFVNILAAKVADLLNLDQAKVEKALAEAPPAPVPGQAGQVAGAVSRAAGMVAGAQPPEQMTLPVGG
jgi:hypothetical protein